MSLHHASDNGLHITMAALRRAAAGPVPQYAESARKQLTRYRREIRRRKETEQ